MFSVDRASNFTKDIERSQFSLVPLHRRRKSVIDLTPHFLSSDQTPPYACVSIVFLSAPCYQEFALFYLGNPLYENGGCVEGGRWAVGGRWWVGPLPDTELLELPF